MAAIQAYLHAHQFPEARALLRLDGQYGTGAVLSDLASLSFVVRGKDYALLDRTEFREALQPTSELAAPLSGYARAEVALPFKRGRFSGRDFVLHPDGTLHCPAGQALSAREQRR